MSLEQELLALRQRQAEIRAQIRRMRNSGTEIRKLEEKLSKYFASAKWIANQIQELRPDYDPVALYNRTAAKQPAPRGRRPRAAAAG